MRKSRFIFAFGALLLSSQFMMCTKIEAPRAELELTKINASNAKILSRSASDSIQQNKDLAIKMSNDNDWKALKKNSDELLSLLLSNDINLYDESNFNTKTFYDHLGDDADDHKEKLALERCTQRYLWEFLSRYRPMF